MQTKYINHTPYNLLLSPHNSLLCEKIPGDTLETRGYCEEEISDMLNGQMPIHELRFTKELPPPQEDVIHIVTLKTKLCKELRDRVDVVAIGSGNQRAGDDAIEVWNFVR